MTVSVESFENKFGCRSHLHAHKELKISKMKFAALIAASLALLGTTNAAVCSPNLGEYFSESTGENAYALQYPRYGQRVDNGPVGRDDSVAVFVGGTFRSNRAAEIEGKIVTLGSLIVQPTGAGNLVQTGQGSQINPNDNQQVILVGGDLEIYREIEVFRHNGPQIVYRGNGIGVERLNFNPPGTITQDPNLDLSVYEEALADIRIKSRYWSELPANGVFINHLNNDPSNRHRFTAAPGNDDCIQVFHLDYDAFLDSNPGNDLSWRPSVDFHSSLTGKTIIINMKAGPDGIITIENLSGFHDPDDGKDGTFDSAFTASILWNFYDATEVNLGSGGGEGPWEGTILVPNGALNVGVPGLNGRVVVGGNVTHDQVGSEFHNYEFDPPCPLPLPDNCTDPCVGDDTCRIFNTNPANSLESSVNFCRITVKTGHDVTFELSTLATDVVDYLFVQYIDPVTELDKCEAFDVTDVNWSNRFVAECFECKAIGIVYVYAVQSNAGGSAGDNGAPLPAYCAVDDTLLNQAKSEGDARTTAFTYVLDCASICVE
jgi:choice-of-anchor A domain-containing protein